MAGGKGGQPVAALCSECPSFWRARSRGVAPSISESSLWMLSRERLMMG